MIYKCGDVHVCMHALYGCVYMYAYVQDLCAESCVGGLGQSLTHVSFGLPES
jgi:hypothetical protein